MEKGDLDEQDYMYRPGRPFRAYEFVLNMIANEDTEPNDGNPQQDSTSAIRPFRNARDGLFNIKLLDALDLVDKQTDTDITLAMQARARQSNSIDAMNLTWVVDSGCTRCALPKQFFRNVKPTRTTNLTSSNGANNAPIYQCERMPRLQEGGQTR